MEIKITVDPELLQALQNLQVHSGKLITMPEATPEPVPVANILESWADAGDTVCIYRQMAGGGSSPRGEYCVRRNGVGFYGASIWQAVQNANR